MLNYLVQREKLLDEATINDDILLSLYGDVNDLSLLTSKQKKEH